MSSTTTTFASMPRVRLPAAGRAAFGLLESLQHGSLELQLPDGSSRWFGSAVDGQPHARLELHNWKVCGAVLSQGDIGLAESFIAGDWSSPDLPSLLRLLFANRDRLEAMVYGRPWAIWLHRLRHWLNRNSRRGSRRNIHAHYDLGNAFYRLWLDPTMNYSSAWFDGDRSGDLVTAQQAKLRRALTQSGLRRGGRLLEIGCGWGALAETAARELDARVCGITLSNEQLVWAKQRLADAQLSADLRYQDYRDIDDGPFDAIVSIEMFEAVGREYWPTFFDTVRRQLAHGGRACIQTITIRDDLFERYLSSSDFIQQYIFPGGLLPSPSAFRAAAARAGLTVVDELTFGADYGETLQRWRQSFLTAEPAVRALGFDTRFVRIWEFYLAYCEAAFATGNTSVVQFTLQHSNSHEPQRSS
jgi:cyclopropane-fatty-acyl-phospholipid synthase